MTQSIQTGSDMAGLSYFPVPYEDECYYSILCRYMQHCGLSTSRAVKILFERQISPRSTLLTPYLSCRIPGWVSEETGITEEKIIRGHTAYCYLAAFSKERSVKKMFQHIRTGAKDSQRIPYRSIMAGQYLRYCPACAYEEKIKNGEMYWHRLHQLDGIHFCLKHGVALAESKVSWYNMKRSFIPASFALRNIYEQSLEECMKGCMPVPAAERKKYDSIYRDIVWLIQHGDETGGIEAIIQKYEAALMKRGWLKARYSNIENASKLMEDIRSFLGEKVLDVLHLSLHEYLKWDSIPLIVAKYLTPLQHVLMMNYLCGSTEKFFTTIVLL